MMSSVAVIHLSFTLVVLADTLASVNSATVPSTPASTNAPFPVCNTTANFKSNSTYEKNLNGLLKALLADTPSQSELFKEHVQGSDPDKVYGYSQCCFTSLSQADCALCIRRAVNQTSVLCSNALTAQIYYDECLVGYGDQQLTSNYLGGLVNTGQYLSDSAFGKNLNTVWTTMKQQAPLTQNPVAFEYGDDPDRAFGLAQCDNLSQSDCSGRFDPALATAGSAQGARIINRDSFFRYETYSFFTGNMPFQIVESTQSPLASVGTPSPSIQQSPKTQGKVSLVVVILTQILGGLALFTIFIFLVKVIKKKQLKSIGLSKDHSSIETMFLDGCPMFSYEALKDATNNFVKENEIGQGGFGVVYKGILYDGSKVAIKHLSRISNQGKEEFLNEVSIITFIQHKNLVKLKGCCIEGEERLLVYEYLDHKSLDLSLFGDILLQNPLKDTLLKKLMFIALEYCFLRLLVEGETKIWDCKVRHNIL